MAERTGPSVGGSALQGAGVIETVESGRPTTGGPVRSDRKETRSSRVARPFAGTRSRAIQLPGPGRDGTRNNLTRNDDSTYLPDSARPPPRTVTPGWRLP
jgi:hypothetical protein